MVKINHRWSFGDEIIYRGLYQGYFWWAIPVTVVQDNRDLIALYWPAGSPVKRPAERVAVPDIVSNPNPRLIDRQWTDTNVLMLCDEELPYCIYAMWAAESGEHLCWYVNLQAPLHRMEIGFETEDYLLDVVFHPDLSKWKLKDEAELIEASQIGMYSKRKVEAIYTAADEAINRIRSGLSPVDDKWADWKPPERWPIPEMPENWDEYHSNPFVV